MKVEDMIALLDEIDPDQEIDRKLIAPDKSLEPVILEIYRLLFRRIDDLSNELEQLRFNLNM